MDERGWADSWAIASILISWPKILFSNNFFMFSDFFCKVNKTQIKIITNNYFEHKFIG